MNINPQEVGNKEVRLYEEKAGTHGLI